MSYYKRHLFFCTNQAEEGKMCCNQHGAKNLHQYAKSKVKEMGLHQPGDYRVNKASCLGRCDQGPVVVVYPDDVWYTYVDQEDVDEIIEEHMLNGREVGRLKLKQT
ncbi:MAG: (2Fe-2S) ferredoxin domain-containing protein [Gammaproteobacteria bacterium]|jgi:(2Fe-2S) ferredoxin|nr:(2Fe-2S) ferredoxin domain-containing protein [Gammaproteobacteria bacterium]MBT3490315.1 (2Fe-2S) ferredoxin domain-containing protein [Gammaproteobacteria bacterium]MBT3717421.1 (2Fe-2S) ferredoxin domain-containing protein [Gammaproteobacteria bacterium]MBT3844200.1 (2Fe-2S) ferredoxin domain-containing protein [Gammaproteobacteria bacterium]MBT3894161.1 (2Fe-2S) ferredoxin domain-containing protein [Gammaproteobacteria bacterium]